MRVTGIGRTLSAGIIFGFGLGVLGGVVSVLANHLIDYRLFRLAAFTFRKSLSHNVLFFLILFAGLSGLWFLLVDRWKLDGFRVLRVLTMTMLVLIAAILVHWLVLPFPLWLITIRKIAGVPGRLMDRKITLDYVIFLVRSRLPGGIALGVGIFVMWLLWRGLGRLDWKRILRLSEGKAVRRTAIAMLLAVLGFNLWSYIDNRSNTPGGPNVVLIGIDTLRADHLSCSGYERNTTPNIDVVASEASVFKRAFATTSWTLPSFHSIMTSLYQASHGVITHKHRLDRSHVTLAEILKNQGYRTAGFVSGPFLKAIYGFDQGFDVYEESVSSASVIEANEDITSPALTDLVLPWLQENAGNRFFLFIHYWDPHADYIPPAPYDKIFDPYYEGTMDGTNIKWTDKVSTLTSKRDVEHIVALYDGEITWTDDHVGQVMNTLRESGLDENTVVVIVSDHGEEFLDHGGKVHGMTIYNEVIHVPLIFRIPGVSEARKFESVVSTVDVMPTILDILDIGLPRSIDGESLMAIINGERDKKRTNEVYSELLHNLTTVVRGRWKLIYDSEVDRFELYDIETDFSESDDLAPSNATIVQELANVLSDWLTAKKSGQVAAPEVHENEKTMKQLKALGYIQ